MFKEYLLVLVEYLFDDFESSSDGLRVAQFPEFRTELGCFQDLLFLNSNSICNSPPWVAVVTTLRLCEHHFFRQGEVVFSTYVAKVSHVVYLCDATYGLLASKNHLYAGIRENESEFWVFRVIRYPLPAPFDHRSKKLMPACFDLLQLMLVREKRLEAV